MKYALLVFLLVPLSSFCSRQLITMPTQTLRIFIDRELEYSVRFFHQVPLTSVVSRQHFVSYVFVRHPELMANLHALISFYANFRGTAFEILKR